jgi:hypothetical protein
MDPIYDPELIEIYEQSHRNIHQLHVAQQLGFVNRKNFHDRLRFDQYTPFHQNIETQILIFDESFVVNLDRPLAYVGKLSKFQLFCKAPFIDRFDQSGPLVAMNFNRCTNDFLWLALKPCEIMDALNQILLQEETEGTEVLARRASRFEYHGSLPWI